MTDIDCEVCDGRGIATRPDQWADECPDDAEELTAIQAFLDDVKGYGGDHDWRGDWYPGGFIADHCWEDYAREFAEDLHGSALREVQWPMSCIDWEQAAEELKQDYSSVEVDGTTYWYR